MAEPIAPRDIVETTGLDSFTVTADQTTNVFGEQDEPPGIPAAVDAEPGEAIQLLGTASLLARIEFVSRESIAGEIPPDTGVVGATATVTHRSAAPLGTTVQVRTEVTGVTGADITFEGTVRTADDGRLVGSATAGLKLVDRDRFRERVPTEDDDLDT